MAATSSCCTEQTAVTPSSTTITRRIDAMLHWLADPWTSDLMLRALIEVVLVGGICGPLNWLFIFALQASKTGNVDLSFS